MILLNLCVIIDYFIIPLNDLASSIALLVFFGKTSAKYFNLLFLTLDSTQ